MDGAPRGWIAKRPEHLGIQQLAYHWTDWGYTEAQHHCVLVCFFETWNAIIKRAEHSDYSCLAKILDDHYRQATFPADAKANAFIYWLSGPNLRRMYSDCASREEFDRRYLSRFGPLFDVIEWLQDQAIHALQGHGGARPIRDDIEQADNISLDDTKAKRKHGTDPSYLIAKLRREHRDDLADRVEAKELSARAAAIEAGFKIGERSLTTLRRAWKRATSAERRIFRTEIGA